MALDSPALFKLCLLLENPHLGLAPDDWMMARWKRSFDFGDMR